MDLRQWARENLAAGLTLADLLAMTPQQVAATVWVEAGPKASQPDPLTQVIEANDARGRKGLAPVCPDWLKKILTERTRGRPNASPR